MTTSASDAARSYRGVPVLVLGASGFIGRRVLRALVAHGARPHAVLRPGDPDAATVAAAAQGTHRLDLERPDGLGDVLERVRPALVFNLAGYGVGRDETDEARAHALNVALVAHLVRSLPDASLPAWSGPRLVHAGSAAEYGTAGGDLVESGPAQPTELYGRTKLEGTRIVASAAAKDPETAVVARLFTVYGPGERAGRLLPSLMAASRDGRSVSLSEGTQRRDFTYVEDIAEGLLRLGAAAPPPYPILNLATGRLTSVRQFVEQAAAVLGIPDEQLQFGALPGGRFDLEHDPVNVSALDRHLGWRPTTAIVDGVRRTRDWDERSVREETP